jgi:hypothetical protein
MSDLPLAIITPSPGKVSPKKPGSNEQLSRDGEVLRVDSFWRWAADERLVSINFDQSAIEARLSNSVVEKTSTDEVEQVDDVEMQATEDASDEDGDSAKAKAKKGKK